MPPLEIRRPHWAVGCAVVALTATIGLMAPTRAWAEPITLAEALSRASTRSPVLATAEAAVLAAQGRARQAGLRPNPELDLSVENFAGTGAFRGTDQTESTLSVGQRFELGGKRTARQRAADAGTDAERLRLAVARADLLNEVRCAYAEAWADGRRVDLARDQFVRAENLQTIATELVDAGREPPLRALRARTAALEAVGRLRAAEAEYAQAQRALAALWRGGRPARTSGPHSGAGPGRRHRPGRGPRRPFGRSRRRRFHRDLRPGTDTIATGCDAERRCPTVSRVGRYGRGGRGLDAGRGF